MIRIDNDLKVKKMSSSGKMGPINSWNLPQYSINPPEFQHNLLTSHCENQIFDESADQIIDDAKR